MVQASARISMDWIDYALFGGVATAASAMVWFRLQPPSPIAKKSLGTGVAQFNPHGHERAQRPPQQLPILSAQALFTQTRTQGLVERIRSSMGYTHDNFKQDVEPLLTNFAEFVQLLPASQSHHHAQPGGLLEHLLEVAAFSLTKRQGYKLPLGSGVEDQLKQAPLWTYAVLIGALLHDIGKPVSDVAVTLYGDNPNHAIGVWSGAAGSMCSLHHNTKATHYTVDFPDKADYRAHGKLSASLLHLLVPHSGMSWLGSEPVVLSTLLSYLNGQSKDGDALSEIVRFADMTSVAENLKSGSRVRFANAKILPLIEQLMHGLSQVVLGGHLPINRPGAAIYIDPDREHLWIVAGLAADKVREVLAKENGGIPNDNTRLFDCWQEYSACLTPPAGVGKNAVWWVMLEKPEPTPWRMVLTMLKFRIKDIYGSQPVPDAFQGTITPTSPQTERPKSQVEQLESDTDAESVVDALQANTTLGQPAMADVDEVLATKSMDSTAKPLINKNVDTHIPGVVEKTFPSVVVDEITDANDAAGTPEWMRDLFADPYAQTTPALNPPAKPLAETAIVDVSNQQIKTGSALTKPEPLEIFLDDEDAAVAPKRKQPKGAVQLASTEPSDAPVSAAPKARWRKTGGAPRLNADAFVAWLQAGLGDGSIIYNESEAFVHFVPKGLLLLSPKAMKVYLDSHPYQGETTDKKGPLQALQRELEKAGYFEWDKVTKTFFHKYRVKQAPKDNKVIKPMSCYLLPNPQAYILPLPAPNDILEKVPDEELV